MNNELNYRGASSDAEQGVDVAARDEAATPRWLRTGQTAPLPDTALEYDDSEVPKFMRSGGTDAADTPASLEHRGPHRISPNNAVHRARNKKSLKRDKGVMRTTRSK